MGNGIEQGVPVQLPEDEWFCWLQQFGPTMVLYARQWVGASGDAEDIVQEAFVRFWNARQRIRDPRAFLYTCVRRCALDFKRAGRRRQMREANVAREMVDDRAMFQQTEDDERRTAIENALGKLSLEQREVIVLKIWGDLTFSQIAETIAVPANTVASRYRYALNRLRELLPQELVG